MLLHAIGDALLGALGETDIGEHFPDTDQRYLGISSIKLLEKVSALVEDKGFRINQLDSVVIAEEPNLSPFKKQIREKIAVVLKMSEKDVNIKAKTNEGLDAMGRKEAIAAYAVAIIIKEA